MYRLQRAAVLTRLMEKLRQHDSPCGETQMQQAAFLLQKLANVPLDLQFVLYRYGPYCFELRDELTALRADGLVRLAPMGHKTHGFVPTDQSAYIQNLYRPTLRRYEDHLMFVAAALGDRGPAALERLNMAVHASQRPETGETVEEKIAWMRRLKPHIPIDLAGAAFNEAQRLAEEARRRLPRHTTNETAKGPEEGDQASRLLQCNVPRPAKRSKRR